jgi:hypothetical protein
MFLEYRSNNILRYGLYGFLIIMFIILLKDSNDILTKKIVIELTIGSVVGLLMSFVGFGLSLYYIGKLNGFSASKWRI